jgi:hypothetical protein
MPRRQTLNLRCCYNLLLYPDAAIRLAVSRAVASRHHVGGASVKTRRLIESTLSLRSPWRVGRHQARGRHCWLPTFCLESSQWRRFADLTITLAHGKRLHGRSLPFLRCGLGPLFDWRSIAAVGRTRHLAPTFGGMTVVDRPTISGQFLARFHAHSLPNKLKNASIYSRFAPAPALF